MRTTQIILEVTERIKATYPERSESPELTEKFIAEAYDSLDSFVPDAWVMDMLNEFLRKRQACRLACISAWALFKDYHLIHNSPDLKQA